MEDKYSIVEISKATEQESDQLLHSIIMSGCRVIRDMTEIYSVYKVRIRKDDLSRVVIVAATAEPEIPQKIYDGEYVAWN